MNKKCTSHHFQRITILISFLVFTVAPLNAGQLEPSAAPDDPVGAMYTVDDIYHQLTTGTEGNKRTDGFVQPANPPAPTGHTLDEIQGVLPALDNSNGVSPLEVPCGRTYWGLREESWGLQQGQLGSTNYYRDADGDGFGDPASAITECQLQLGYVTDNTDCDDTNALINPAAHEISQNGIDENCDGMDLTRFTDLGDGTIRDNESGYIWLKNATCYDLLPCGAPPDDPSFPIPNLASGQCGLTDGSVPGQWRLPTLSEALSLIDTRFVGPALCNTDCTAQWSPDDAFANIWIDGNMALSDPTGTGVSLWDGSIIEFVGVHGCLANDWDVTLLPLRADSACDPTGTYTLDQPINYSCAFGFFNINVDAMTFTSDGTSIFLSPNSNIDQLNGSPAYCPSGAISATNSIEGTCTEIYSLEGNFTGTNTWSGVFTIEFSGAGCFDCTTQIFNVTGTR